MQIDKVIYRKANLNDSIAEITRAIYLTDDYIYPALHNIYEEFLDCIRESLIDKNSGIIISGNIPLRGCSTCEINGQIGDTSKYIVLPSGTMSYTDVRVSGKVMVRVKNNGGKATISVFLGDIECRVGQSYIEAKSTGAFEQKWLNYITNK